MNRIHVILLAAGDSRRFGGNKLLHDYNGKPLFRHVTDKLTDISSVGIKILISQYEEILQYGRSNGYFCLKNKDPKLGISHSIKMGIEAIEASENYRPGDAVLFSVCDQPEISEDTIKRLMKTYERSEKKICCIAYKDILGNPVIFSDSYFRELKELTGDVGGKVIVKRHLQEVELCPAKEAGELRDLDYPSDIKPLVLVRGGGDLATGTIHRLHREGFRVIVSEIARPACIRRQVSFCEAVYEGQQEVEGVTAVYVSASEGSMRGELEEVWNSGKVPVIIDPYGEAAQRFQPDIVVDAILAKRNLGTSREMAPLTIGLGPGFVAGQDVDVVVETMRGEHLGEIYHEGSAIPNTGIPGVIAGYSKERVIHAPSSGRFQAETAIGEQVRTGDILGYILSEDKKIPVLATMPGLLRGMIKEGYPVKKGLKIMDIEPRINERERCFQISDKAKKIGESVYQVIKEYEANKSQG